MVQRRNYHHLEFFSKRFFICSCFDDDVITIESSASFFVFCFRCHNSSSRMVDGSSTPLVSGRRSTAKATRKHMKAKIEPGSHSTFLAWKRRNGQLEVGRDIWWIMNVIEKKEFSKFFIQVRRTCMLTLSKWILVFGLVSEDHTSHNINSWF